MEELWSDRHRFLRTGGKMLKSYGSGSVHRQELHPESGQRRSGISRFPVLPEVMQMYKCGTLWSCPRHFRFIQISAHCSGCGWRIVVDQSVSIRISGVRGDSWPKHRHTAYFCFLYATVPFIICTYWWYFWLEIDQNRKNCLVFCVVL